jgi:S-DNA-T family DNA segregation ATPase FtsK/SpoIIIE
MRIGTFDLDQFYPETTLQTVTAATLLTVPALVTGSFAAGASALGLAWVARQSITAWKRDNCLLGSDLDAVDTRDHAAQNSEITDVLANYGLLNARLHQSLAGPVLTRHLVAVPAGTKLGKLPDDDIARDLGVPAVTIGANAGKGLISIDVPREDRQTVVFSKLLQSPEWAERVGKLPCMPAVDVTGKPVVFDLESAPHLLVGGTTGQGKSVFMNALILSLMASGADFRLMIGDGKGEDLAPFYGNSKHLLNDSEVTAIETEVEGIAHQVQWLAAEMDNRFKTGNKPFPIVLVIDELADLVMRDDKDATIVKSLSRIAQKGRSARIHLVIGTQYPSADVTPPILRMNIPSRAGLTVAKDYESKVVLGETGCEKLLSLGDCLLKLIGRGVDRVHGAMVTGEDMKRFMV